MAATKYTSRALKRDQNRLRIIKQQAEIDKLRRHAEAMAKALDNIEVMTDDDQGEIRWTAVYALNAYRKAYPRIST